MEEKLTMKGIRALGVTAVLWGALLQGERMEAAAITLNASEVLTPGEGSFELWFRADGGLQEAPKEAFYSPLRIWTRYAPNGRREDEPLFLYRIQKQKAASDPSAALLQGSGVLPGYRHDLFLRMGEVLLTVSGARLKLEEGVWQCLAVTWKEEGGELELSLYLNGKQLHQLRGAGPTALPREGQLVIGTRNDDNPVLMTVAAYRFSKRALKTQELEAFVYGEPERTDDTLVVETFSEVAEGSEGELPLASGAILSGAYRIVPGPNGPAVQLHQSR